MELVKPNMKLTCLILLLSVLSFLSCSSESEQKIISKVGSYEITENQFVERYSKYLFETGMQDNIINRRSILSNMIDEIILQHYDNNDKIYDNMEFRKNLEWVRKQSILGLLKDREVYAKISASDDELRRTFLRVNEQISARHLYAQTEEEANQLYQLLQTGVSFETLAKQVFSDSTLKNNGGFIGYFTWGDMDPVFEDVAYSMKPGEISKPVKTSNGYSIIKVEDRFPHPLLTEYEYLNKKSKLERALKIRKKRPSEVEFVSGLIDFNKVTINEKATNDLFKQIDPRRLIDGGLEFQNINDNVCSDFNGKKFTSHQIIERINNLPEFHREKVTSTKNLNAVIKGFYMQDVLLDKAEDLGYDENEEVEKVYSQLSKNLFLQFKFNEIIENESIPDSIVQKFFAQNTEFFSTHRQVNIQEIIVDNKGRADSIYKALQSKANFASLAKKYSLRKYSAENNGELGLANITKFGNLKDYFWNAPLNVLLKPIEIQGLYGIFKVIEKVESRPLAFEEVKNEAMAAAKFKFQKDLIRNYINKLYDNVEVVTDDALLTSITIGK